MLHFIWSINLNLRNHQVNAALFETAVSLHVQITLINSYAT